MDTVGCAGLTRRLVYSLVYSGEPLPPKENEKRARQLNEILSKGLIHAKGIDTSNISSWAEFISYFADDLSPENKP